jgi:hypothetical protein
MVLMVAGMVYIGIGASYMVADIPPTRLQSLTLALQWLSIAQWGLIFMIAGVLAIISSRWPPFLDTWGYAVLTGLSAGWGAFYGLGIIFKHTPVANVSAVMTWFLIAFMWWAISGLLNPAVVVHVEASHGRS